MGRACERVRDVLGRRHHPALSGSSRVRAPPRAFLRHSERLCFWVCVCVFSCVSFFVCVFFCVFFCVSFFVSLFLWLVFNPAPSGSSRPAPAFPGASPAEAFPNVSTTPSASPAFRNFEKTRGHRMGPKQRNKLMITIVLSSPALGGPRSGRAPRPAVAKKCEKVVPYLGANS